MTRSQQHRSKTSHITPREVRARRHLIGWIGSMMFISLLMAAILMRSWPMFWIAVPLGVMYGLLLTMPVFLAVVSGDDDDEGNQL